MTVEEYLEVLETGKPTIIHKGMLKHFPFPIDPQNDCLGIEEIQKLRNNPYGIEEGSEFLKVYYTDGQIEYTSRESDGALLPHSIIIYGPLSQENSDTEIHFKQVKEEDTDPFKDYLTYNDIYLEIEVTKPEKGIFFEWDSTKNRK